MFRHLKIKRNDEFLVRVLVRFLFIHLERLTTIDLARQLSWSHGTAFYAQVQQIFVWVRRRGKVKYSMQQQQQLVAFRMLWLVVWKCVGCVVE